MIPRQPEKPNADTLIADVLPEQLEQFNGPTLARPATSDNYQLDVWETFPVGRVSDGSYNSLPAPTGFVLKGG
jgi:hypothetical protein